MKYLKITLLIFLGSLVSSVTGVNAWASYIFNDEIYKGTTITIKPLNFTTDVSTQQKNTTDEQFVVIESCIDNVSGDGRAIEGYLKMGDVSTNYRGLNVGKAWFGEKSMQKGSWTLTVRSVKMLPTTAKCKGLWAYESTPDN